MSEPNEDTDKFLNAFPVWLKSLGPDARALAAVVSSDASESGRVVLAGGLNYLLKSVDLIADGIEDLGYLDDAFVLRVAAKAALAFDVDAATHPEAKRLAQEAELIEAFLESDYQRLVDYVAGLAETPVRGRSARQIVTDDAALHAFAQDVEAWAQSFEVPSFLRDEKNLVKLRAFMHTKLPAS